VIDQQRALELIARHRAGDPRAANELARISRPILVTNAGRYRHSFGPDDALSIASIGFMRALERFDLDRKGLWVTGLWYHSRSALNLEYRTVHRQKRLAPQRPVSMDDDARALHDTLAAPELDEEVPEHPLELSDFLEALTPLQRHVVERKLEGLKNGAIAEQLGCTHQAVSDSYRKAVRRLRQAVRRR
jgi:RNA polymerase sigma factor (sigma-70 family)